MSNPPREIAVGTKWSIDQPCAKKLGIGERDRFAVEVTRVNPDNTFEIEASGKRFSIRRQDFLFPLGHPYNPTGMPKEGSDESAYWFVGASWDEGDQTARFIKEGIWENGYTDRYLDLVKSMKPGDRIAIKATYTRKKKLPFDNRENAVSVMEIKAIGTILENVDDGRKIKVEWKPLEPTREWYFYTYQKTIWQIRPGDWAADALIAFTFDAVPQDIDFFRNRPFWRERYGDQPETQQFEWTKFYEAVADKLLEYRANRTALVSGIEQIAKEVGLSYLEDHFADNSSHFLTDICPFTTFGIFNRGITNGKRREIAAKLASFLGVEEAVPESFDGVPLLNNQKSWFFNYEKKREKDDIDVLWSVFETGLRYADSDDPEANTRFIQAFDNAMGRWGVAWNLTTALYWCRPWKFATLDSRSRNYITGKLGIRIPQKGGHRGCGGSDYLNLIERLETRFGEESAPVHSFPELSYAAFQEESEGVDEELETDDVSVAEASIADPYAVDDILADGCFLERSEIEMFLARLREKKNLIFQGPPGTGKTWLAKRMAYALVGNRDADKVRALQFHPNLSYEDFVRGWRPNAEGRLSLEDGPFLDLINDAKASACISHVMVIEEINRGNPAQIFGEMLTLLEADKRTPDEALPLCYRRTKQERVYIPENVYVIGTMNIADRSLALVDFALRRRFAFVDLKPEFGKAWQAWCSERITKEDLEFLGFIENRVASLNKQIAGDSSLGPQFQIGHSFFTPLKNDRIEDLHSWFKRIVETEIRPLLAEYWFDDAGKAEDAYRRLLNDLA